MAKPVKPFQTNTRVAPLPATGLKLDAREGPFFDSVGQEQHAIAGVTIDYYQLNPSRSTVDALYGEPILRVFDGPYKLQSLFSFGKRRSTAEKSGLEMTLLATLYIHRADMEEGRLPLEPSENDIVHVWPTPYFDKFAVDQSDDLGAGLFYSVLDGVPNGVVFDNPAFSGFEIFLKRVLDMTPERLINGY